MFLFLITSFSFLFLYKSLPLRPIPPWAYEMRLLSLWFWRDFSFFPMAKSIRNIMSCSLAQFPSKLSLKKKNFSLKVENVEMTLLDLPELILETILQRLPPDGLCSMAGVCLSLRDRCTSDHLWERHLTQKWGIVIGPSARREWQWHVASRKDSSFLEGGRGSGFISFLSQHWPLSLIRSTLHSSSKRKLSSPVDSIMSWYLALESGKFWFPAQVYNRENGHVGFMLSCYDAYLSYDPTTDTFKAKYPPHGRKAIAMEKGVSWDRIRAPPVDSSPHDLYISDCLNELQPGDHIEIQWRRNREFPYGWWYGVVGHLQLCDGNDNYCHCRDSDSVVLEFNQYAPGSQWRHTSISRKDHREEGNEADGFYGGIRKLYSNREISTWRRLWPAEILE